LSQRYGGALFPVFADTFAGLRLLSGFLVSHEMDIH
jgi:hypothetical protein